MIIHTLSDNSKISLKPIDDSMIRDYFQTKHEVLYFNTTECIFEITNNKIFKVTENNYREPYILSDNISFSIQSTDNHRKELFYLPIHYTYIKKEIKKYRLSADSLLTLVLVNNKQVYFETTENEITHSIKEDLITFLSMLKLYT